MWNVFVSVHVKGAGIYEVRVCEQVGVCVEYVGVKHVACACVLGICTCGMYGRSTLWCVSTPCVGGSDCMLEYVWLFLHDSWYF